MVKNDRKFLKLCIDLATSDLKNLGSVIDEVFRYGFFVDPNDVSALKENVEAFALANTEREPFFVQIERTGGAEQLSVEEDNISLKENTTYHGAVKYFLKNPPEISEREKAMEKARLTDVISKQSKSNIDSVVNSLLALWLEEKLRVFPKDLPLNHLVGQFYESIAKYCEKKNCGMSEFPLRICKHCEKPFFGRLREQMFCKKRCGELFHNIRAYHRKKAEGKKKSAR